MPLFQILTRNDKPADESGLKDTVLLDAFDKVTLLTYFEESRHVDVSLHIPEHAEYGMMAHLRWPPRPESRHAFAVRTEPKSVPRSRRDCAFPIRETGMVVALVEAGGHDVEDQLVPAHRPVRLSLVDGRHELDAQLH